MHSDVREDIYVVEKGYEEDDDFSPVRTVDLLVVEFGEEQGVKTYIVPPPLICMSLSSTLNEFSNGLIIQHSWSWNRILHIGRWSGSPDDTASIEEQTSCDARSWTRCKP
jgi:hypothetical protein